MDQGWRRVRRIAGSAAPESSLLSQSLLLLVSSSSSLSSKPLLSPTSIWPLCKRGSWSSSVHSS